MTKIDVERLVLLHEEQKKKKNCESIASFLIYNT